MGLADRLEHRWRSLSAQQRILSQSSAGSSIRDEGRTPKLSQESQATGTKGHSGPALCPQLSSRLGPRSLSLRRCPALWVSKSRSPNDKVHTHPWFSEGPGSEDHETSTTGDTPKEKAKWTSSTNADYGTLQSRCRQKATTPRVPVVQPLGASNKGEDKTKKKPIFKVIKRALPQS